MGFAEEPAAAASAMLSTPVLRSAMRDGSASRLANRTISSLVESGLAIGASTVRTLIWRCDRWLSRHYRNDFVYRKAVLRQMFPCGGRVVLPEFRVSRSIVDILAITDSLHAIEIKSDLDSTSRLTNQLRDYRRIAPLVSIVASEHVVEQVLATPEFETVGLHWLDTNGHVETVRAARPSYEFLDSEILMRSLRRAEYLRVLSALGATVPDLPNTRVFSYALAATRDLDPLVFHDAVAEQLKRRQPRAGRSLIARLPEPVRPAILQINPTRQQISGLQDWMNQEVANVHA
ncbi:sce7726 family protein [Actinomyces sp. MRS3W]|uniref:sce7726 family protein n=1 Tax=Actinomyces sp. MRS3W TaxID=2800796 RepID=UPI0028FDA470|nr:sce7726 family protein [Actinomyces sp. MRS3W]MDU0349054.1 sce7726 family protein [Actinomyces sp. MRS3W]